MTDREEAVEHFRELYQNGELENYCTQLLNKVAADAEKRKELFLYYFAQNNIPYAKFKYPFEFELWRTFSQNRVA